MRVKLAGQQWHRRLVNRLSTDGVANVGDCDWETKTIRIRRGQTPHDELDTDIHEAMHAIFPWLVEENVEQAATELADLLWKIGYRKLLTTRKTRSP